MSLGTRLDERDREALKRLEIDNKTWRGGTTATRREVVERLEEVAQSIRARACTEKAGAR